MKNDFYPCFLVEHDAYFSIILTDFHLFQDYFDNKEIGGYTIERLALKLAKENNLLKKISFDSEASMFCAYSENKEILLKFCHLFAEITGNVEIVDINSNSQIDFEKAKKLLFKGFVFGLDKIAQKEFLEYVPFPPLSKAQKSYLNDIEKGTKEQKIQASKKNNSEARTKIRKWDNYLSHPNTITIFLNAIDKEKDEAVIQELIWALVFICDRHLPDFRIQPYFLKALENKSATIRWLGIIGLQGLFEYPNEIALKMTTDKSKKVKEAAERLLKGNREFPNWMFNNLNFKE